MNKEILDFVLERFSKDEVLAINLTGSRNNNLHREDSDYDLVVVKRPTISSLLGDYSKPKHSVNEIADYRVYDLVYYINRVAVKGVYNDFETIYREPIYQHEDFKVISQMLYDNKEKLLNKRGLVYSLKGSLYQIYQKLSNESGKVDLEKIKFNKEVANFFRYRTQLEKLLDEDIFYVVFEKDLRSEFLRLKAELPVSIEEYNKSEFEELIKQIKKVSDRAQEYFEKIKDVKSKERDEVLQELISEVLKIC